MSITNVGDALLLSLSFLGVGFLSWSVSQRLTQVEAIAARHASELEKLHAINQEVIHKMSNGVMVINHTRHVVLSNDAAIHLLGLEIPHTEICQENNDEPQQIMQQQLNSLIDKDLGRQHPKLKQWLQSTPEFRQSRFNYRLPKPNDLTDQLRLNTTPLHDGSLLIILEDLRYEQTHAQQLKLASLGQLTASIAHEIRNPLATISQASQLLIEDCKDYNVASNTPSTQQNANNINNNNINDKEGDHIELYQMIFQQTKRVNRIIEDVLKLSRQAKPEQTKIELIAWLEQFIADHYNNHDVFIRTNCHPKIYFDKHQLEQILINLINNGLRFSSKSHSHAFVEVEVSCQQNDVIIDILDTGEGVSEAQQASLFHPFFTTDNEGTGLGLYLSQAFTEANHARLMYVPSHEKTCFRLLIPSISSPNNAQAMSETLADITARNKQTK